MINMKIFHSLKSGFYRALKSRKGVLIVWFSLFLLVLALIYPLRGSFNSAFSNSMITEKLADGFNIEVFADLGSTFGSLISFFTAGFMFIYLIGFILNAFLTAGLFGSVKKENAEFSAQEFFRASSKNFWSFLIISLIITVIIDLFSGILIGVPMMIVANSDTISEKSRITIVIAAVVILLLTLPVFYLIADYSRAWRASHEDNSCFKALGYGFSRTFRKFWSSYIMMVFLIFSQIILGVLILLILPGWKPVTGGGVFLLLIISQLLLFARLFLKTWRYASVTSMMEETTKTIPKNINLIQDEQGRSN
jgi:MFS-type transporter involved in bile tolerance (Atg22 family)